jgi:molecular chaperone HscB
MLLDTTSALTRDDFSLFQLPRRFSIDLEDLDQRWKAIQRQVHPDRFSMAGAAAQRVAMQWSSRINEAYRRLKNPLARASYLCELLGAPIQAENNTAMPGSFLMEQMALRENLEEAVHLHDFEELVSTVQKSIAQRQALCAKWLDEVSPVQPQEAAQEVRAWMFMDRFLQDVQKRVAQLSEDPS